SHVVQVRGLGADHPKSIQALGRDIDVPRCVKWRRAYEKHVLWPVQSAGARGECSPAGHRRPRHSKTATTVSPQAESNSISPQTGSMTAQRCGTAIPARRRHGVGFSEASTAESRGSTPGWPTSRQQSFQRTRGSIFYFEVVATGEARAIRDKAIDRCIATQV